MVKKLNLQLSMSFLQAYDPFGKPHLCNLDNAEIILSKREIRFLVGKPACKLYNSICMRFCIYLNVNCSINDQGTKKTWTRFKKILDAMKNIFMC